MTVDIDKYAVNKAAAQRNYLDKKAKGEKDIGHILSTLACSTMCPAIVVAYWIGEVDNWPEEIIQTIKNLIKFYGYEEITGKPPGAPI